jgi:hypothetical protein
MEMALFLPIRIEHVRIMRKMAQSGLADPCAIIANKASVVAKK